MYKNLRISQFYGYVMYKILQFTNKYVIILQ